eukprot:12418839-Karenia_brevis.AAC.1
MAGSQQTKVNANSYEKRNKFHWYFSRIVLEEDRDKAEKLRHNNKKITSTLWNKISEKRGVAL